MRRFAWIVLVGGVCLAAPGTSQSPPQNQVEARLFVLESKVSDLQASALATNAKLDKLTDKVDKLTENVASLNTKMSIIQWFGGAFGVLLLGTVWKLMTERSQPQVNTPGSGSMKELIEIAVKEALRADQAKEKPSR